MTSLVLISYFDGEPTQHPNLDEALEYLAGYDSDDVFVLVHLAWHPEAVWSCQAYNPGQVADMLYQRRKEMSADTRHEQSLKTRG